MVDVWKVIIALGGCLVIAGGVAHAIAKAYFSKLNEKLDEMSDLTLRVNDHTNQIAALDRRFLELTGKLAAIEGSLMAQMRSMEGQIAQVNVNLAELRGQLRVFDRIRGMIGKRDEDKE